MRRINIYIYIHPICRAQRNGNGNGNATRAMANANKHKQQCNTNRQCVLVNEFISWRCKTAITTKPNSIYQYSQTREFHLRALHSTLFHEFQSQQDCAKRNKNKWSNKKKIIIVNARRRRCASSVNEIFSTDSEKRLLRYQGLSERAQQLVNSVNIGEGLK